MSFKSHYFAELFFIYYIIILFIIYLFYIFFINILFIGAKYMMLKKFVFILKDLCKYKGCKLHDDGKIFTYSKIMTIVLMLKASKWAFY